MSPELLVALRGSQQLRRYRMVWIGTKIPRGATVGGVAIVWTQHGIIRGENGQALGYYQRVREWDSPTKDQHEMILQVNSDAVAPDGSPCELLDMSQSV